MKYLKLFFAFILASLAFVACGGDDVELVEVSVTPTELTFTTQGGQQSVSVNGVASDKVSVSANGEWYTLNVVPNNATSCYVRVKVVENKTYEPRHADIRITADGKEFTVKMNQEALPEPVKPDGDIVAGAMAVSRSFGMGWNLGNQLDAQNTWSFPTPVADETCWGNPLCTQATFDGLKEKGIQSVRIPVTWAGHIGEAPSYPIDEKWMNRVAEVVGYAKKAGLKAIINIHHDEGSGETDPQKAGWLDIKKAAYDSNLNAQIEAKLSAVWKQIAERFKGEGDWLVFESMNELQDGGWGWGQSRNDGGKQYACLNHWQQVFVDAVRSVGGENTNRWLCVVGYAQNPSLTVEHLVLPTDPTEGRLMVAVHCYDPGEYCLNGKQSTWGHSGSEANYKTGEKQITDLFQTVKSKYTDKGIPVILGEMGCVNRSADRDKKFQKYYLEYVTRAACTYGLAPFLWDNGTKTTGNESFGFIDHATGAYLNYASEIIPTMVKAATDPDANYSLESIYNKAPK